LKKNDEIGMPTAIKKVVEAVAELRSSTTTKSNRWFRQISRA
jgi:6-phosphofructokinase